MAVDEQNSDDHRRLPDPPTRHPPQFVEVLCTSSGKTRRFAAGTDAIFAETVINRKLEGGGPRVWHIEAVKEREEPITFGPHSVLVEYGDGWRLQTVPEPEDFRKRGGPFVHETPSSPPPLVDKFLKDLRATQDVRPLILQSNISYTYIAKILLAFILIFAMGAALTFALESLPKLILYFNSL